MKWILLITIFSLIMPSKMALHMFQQNRYELSRYTMWLKDYFKNNKTQILKGVGVFIVAFSIAAFVNYLLGALVILYCSLTIFEKELNRKYIKPLVYTNRVKRQIIVMLLAYGLFLTAVYNIGFNCMMYVTLFSPIIPYLMIYVVAFITSPIEAFFRERFKNKAKRQLNSHPNLIKIGITGSYGKTSSKNIVNEILSESLYTLPTPASFNTPMGITMTIRESLKNTHEAFIVEMGADKVGDIVELSNFIEPNYALITSIGPQHLATFKKLDNIIKEKMSLVEKLPNDGVAIINKDNENINNYVIKNKNIKVISYGINNQNVDYRATNIKYSINGSEFDVIYNNELYKFKTRLLGEHNVLNILSGIALGRSLNISWQKLISAVANVKFIEHRLELKRINNRMFIDNAFNSNPEGAAMSLNVISMMPPTRYVITPGMIDLGVIQAEENFKFGYNMKDKVDVAILVGKNQTKPIYEGLQKSDFNMSNVFVFDTVQEALKYVYQVSNENDIILLENDLPDAFNN